MAKIEPVDFGKITDGLLNAFNQISCFLNGIGDTVEVLQRESKRHELHFSNNGVFLGMTSLANPVVSYTAKHWSATFVQGECEDLPDNVNGLWEEYASADEALKGLPEKIVQVLNQHNGNKPWRSMVRQECFDILLVWPGEVIYNLGARKVGNHIPTLLENAKQSDPYEKWAYFRKRLDFYRSQILAIRGDVVCLESDAAKNCGGGDSAKKTKAKQTTSKGNSKGETNTKMLIIAALTEHHQYSNGRCEDVGHAGVNKLARYLELSSSTVSEFFKTEFGGHDKYKIACGNLGNLANALKMLNGELTPSILFNPQGNDDSNLADK